MLNILLSKEFIKIKDKGEIYILIRVKSRRWSCCATSATKGFKIYCFEIDT